MPIRKIAITKYQSKSFFILYFTYKIKLKPSSIYTAGKEMPPPHNCTKCDVLVLDLLDHNLPADYPKKEFIRDKARRRQVPIVAKSIKRLLSDYAPFDMQKLWNDAVFEAKMTGSINWRTISNALTSNLCESAEKWNDEIEYLQDLALADGVIKMKGMTHGRAMILANDWISYCVYLVWTHMHTYHYNHNFPGNQAPPEIFQFHSKLGGAYVADDLYW